MYAKHRTFDMETQDTGWNYQVSYKRLQKFGFLKSCFFCSNDLKLNYLHVAQAAQFCSAHFSVLLYTEVWAQERLEDIRRENTVDTLSCTDTNMLDVIYEHMDQHTKKALQRILEKVI